MPDDVGDEPDPPKVVRGIGLALLLAVPFWIVVAAVYFMFT